MSSSPGPSKFCPERNTQLTNDIVCDTCGDDAERLRTIPRTSPSAPPASTATRDPLVPVAAKGRVCWGREANQLTRPGKGVAGKAAVSA